MTDLTQIPLWELEMKETEFDKKIDSAPPYLKAILTPTQHRYYTYYMYGGLKLADIAMYFDVDISTVCRTIKNARKRILAYIEQQQRESVKGV